MVCCPRDSVCVVLGYLESGPTSWERKREGLRESRRRPGKEGPVERQRGSGQLHAAKGFGSVFPCGFAYFSFQSLTLAQVIVSVG